MAEQKLKAWRIIFDVMIDRSQVLYCLVFKAPFLNGIINKVKRFVREDPFQLIAFGFYHDLRRHTKDIRRSEK